jgi:hypothetical protein
VAAGVASLVASVLASDPCAVGVSLGLVEVLAVMNLRGINESGTVFAPGHLVTEPGIGCRFVP